jgi:hypothetical protein
MSCIVSRLRHHPNLCYGYRVPGTSYGEHWNLLKKILTKVYGRNLRGEPVVPVPWIFFKSTGSVPIKRYRYYQ